MGSSLPAFDHLLDLGRGVFDGLPESRGEDAFDGLGEAGSSHDVLNTCRQDWITVNVISSALESMFSYRETSNRPTVIQQSIVSRSST